MKLIDNKPLINFAKFMQSNGINIYVVGGFVRNKLQGLNDKECGDIDICSACKLDDLIKLSTIGNFGVRIINSKLGVCEIDLGELKVEHATFRKEICDNLGKHYPLKVEFINSLKEDALRRDFSINAIYYDLINERIIDPVSGVKDLDNFCLKCIGDAKTRFEEDAERMLRAVRIACSYGFDIEQHCKDAIIKEAKLISNINPARRNREFFKMLHCDMVCPTLTKNSYPQMRAILLLEELGLLKYVLPELYNLNSRKSKKDYFKDIIVRLRYSSYKSRIVTLFSGIIEAFNYFHLLENEDLFLDYLISTYIATDIANNENCTFLQKSIKFSLNFTKHGVNRKTFDLLKGESPVIMSLVLENLMAIGFANSAGKNEGKLAKKLKQFLGKT